MRADHQCAIRAKAIGCLPSAGSLDCEVVVDEARLGRGVPILHPVALAAVAMLVVNDHVLKASFPGWVTGKLSDVAGLAFFPLLLLAAAEAIALVGGVRLDRGCAARAAAALSGAMFAAIKVVPAAGEAYRIGLAVLRWPAHAAAALFAGEALPPVGRVVLCADATDLIALPAVLVAVWIVAPSVGAGPPQAGRGHCRPYHCRVTRSRGSCSRHARYHAIVRSQPAAR